MEIPYIVTPRKDTGLFNSKIAIWLFLASEVMLFGGLFSAYIFLRIGADYPWPERTLPVIPGLINTFVLIASSVTVVFAWASLKLRQWGRFKFFMSLTVGAAVLFMCLKGVEYSVKFKHQAVRLPDYSVIEGHLSYKKDEEGNKIGEKDRIYIKAEEINFSTVRYHKPWVKDLIAQAEAAGSKLVLAEAIKLDSGKGVTLASAGEPLTVDLLDEIKQAHLEARAHNAKLRTVALRDKWSEVKDANPGKRGWQLANDVTVDASALELMPEISAVSFKLDPPAKLDFKPRDIKESDGQSRLRDDTVIRGQLLASPMVFHNVDAIDFQYLAMKAEEKGEDPIDAIERSWIIQNFDFAREAWEWHKGKVAVMEKDLAEDGRVPTEKDRYRIGWKELRDKSEEENGPKLGFIKGFLGEEFTGPNYDARGEETFPHFELPREQVAFASKFVPAWNTYYAVYFTITGLHGLHVIGGALVLAYYLLFTRKMYETNPEWLANRVEVAGLFWHFVDLVWIFAFPIFYLM